MITIRNLQDLCALIDARTPDALQHQVYRYTECGGSMAFLYRHTPPKDAEFWYHGAPSHIDPQEATCVGIKLTSIVEGSEATFDGDTLRFPFTEEAYRVEEQRMEAFCEAEWQKANGEREETICTYLLGPRAIQVRGEWEFDTPDNEYERFRFYEGDTCLNPEDPMDASGGAPIPTKAEVSTFLGELAARKRQA